MSPAPAPPTRCYVVFEGGGAKGYAHVGVLRALEKENLDIRGFAGTSAGAIMACLCAAGYRADELIRVKPDGGIHHLLLDLNIDRPSSLLGPGVDEFLSVFEGPKWYLKHKERRERGEAAGVQKAVRAAGSFIGLDLPRLPKRTPLKPMRLASLVPRLRKGWRFFKEERAGFSTVEGLQRALRLALEKRGIDPNITYLGWSLASDIDGRPLKPLRTVTADITRGRVVLCSAETTPDVPVVDAVSASGAIPLLFEPVPLDLPDQQGDSPTTRRCLCVDGGINSNLPGWAFDAERAIDREAFTILSEIEDTGWDAPEPNLISMAQPLGFTAVFGSKSVGLRNLGRNKRITVAPSLSLLSFEPYAKELAKDLHEAEIKAATPFNDERRLMDFLASGQTALEHALAKRGLPAGRLRRALATSNTDDPTVEEYSDGLIQMRFCSGYDEDGDFRALFPYTRSVIGAVLNFGQPAVASIADVTGKGAFLQMPVDARALTQQRQDLTWWAIIPFAAELADANLPYRDVALVFDSDETFVEEKRLDYLEVAASVQKALERASA